MLRTQLPLKHLAEKSHPSSEGSRNLRKIWSVTRRVVPKRTRQIRPLMAFELDSKTTTEKSPKTTRKSISLSFLALPLPNQKNKTSIRRSAGAKRKKSWSIFNQEAKQRKKLPCLNYHLAAFLSQPRPLCPRDRAVAALDKPQLPLATAILARTILISATTVTSLRCFTVKPQSPIRSQSIHSVPCRRQRTT